VAVEKVLCTSFTAVVEDDDPPFFEENCMLHSWRVAVLQDEPSLRPEPQGEGRVKPQRPLGFFNSHSRSDIDFNSKKYCLTFICIMIRCGIDARAEDKGWQKNWSIGNVPASEP